MSLWYLEPCEVIITKIVIGSIDGEALVDSIFQQKGCGGSLKGGLSTLYLL
jgi:hypothetical protein